MMSWCQYNSTILSYNKFSEEQQNGCLFRIRIETVPKDVKKKCLLIRSESGMSTDSKRMMIGSDLNSFHGWREINKINRKSKKVVDDDGVSEKLDQWVRDSVVEIVSNIEEAPFLVHIFSDNETEKCSSITRKTRLVREKASPESWPLIKTRWDWGTSPIPNGVILVEELSNEELTDEEKMIINPAGFEFDGQLHQSTNKVWGVLIQGRGSVNCTACYILKTCRVQSVSGFCTHFCLVRVECFRESVEIQLKKLWLQR